MYTRTIMQETLFGEKGILSFSCSVVLNNLKPFTVRSILTAFTTKKPSQSFTIEKEPRGLISFSFNSRFQLIYWTCLFFPRVFHRPSQQRTRKWPQCTELVQTKRVLSVPISESICVFVRPGPGVKYNSLVFNDL